MINIYLKDGSHKEFDEGISVYEIAQSISQGLARAALAAKVDDRVVDLSYRVNNDCNLSILTFDDEDGRKAFWHTSSHIMAQAVKKLFPQVKLAIGPAIDNGFYYDLI
mgnify:FL=1